MGLLLTSVMQMVGTQGSVVKLYFLTISLLIRFKAAPESLNTVKVMGPSLVVSRTGMRNYFEIGREN